MNDGPHVGNAVRCSLGDADGCCVGARVGPVLGGCDGEAVAVGAAVGRLVGAADGAIDGFSDAPPTAVVGGAVGLTQRRNGVAVGEADLSVGDADGVAVGAAVGCAEGAAVGTDDGVAVGAAVRMAVGIGEGVAARMADRAGVADLRRPQRPSACSSSSAAVRGSNDSDTRTGDTCARAWRVRATRVGARGMGMGAYADRQCEADGELGTHGGEGRRGEVGEAEGEERRRCRRRCGTHTCTHARTYAQAPAHLA
jgi:hypothetical protein